MQEEQNLLALAEQCIEELCQADNARDYALFIKRMERSDGLSQQKFLEDTERMHARLGLYLSRSYMGCIEYKSEHEHRRFVWSAVYEKNNALITMGMYKKDDHWYCTGSAVD